MGTRSLTNVYAEDGKQIMCMYRQFDGYPDGHGKELAEFIASKTLVNGIPCGTGVDPSTLANGIGCLAAQIVSFFKEEPGKFYLYPPGTSDVGEEYVYSVFADRIVCRYPHGKVLFDGKPSDFAVDESEE